MKKVLLPLFILFFFFGFAQKVELGTVLNMQNTNIINSRVTQGKAVIGKGIWNAGFGIIAIYNFKERSIVKSGLQFEFNNLKRGSQSETYKDSKILIESKQYNLLYRLSSIDSNKYLLFMKTGLGYVVLDNKDYYKGSVPQIDAFNDNLKEEIKVKNEEFTFIFGIGVEKYVLKNKLKAFIETNLDMAINRLNSNSGSYRSQSLGFVAGLKYVLNLKKTN